MLEDSTATGAKLSEARCSLEKTQAALVEAEARLESERAANAGLKAAVMETNEVQWCSDRQKSLRNKINKKSGVLCIGCFLFFRIGDAIPGPALLGEVPEYKCSTFRAG